VVCQDELWGVPMTMDFFLFRTVQIRQEIEMAGFTVDEDIERHSYPEGRVPEAKSSDLSRRLELRAELPLKLDL
jgi:hypothetical protein